MPARHVLLAVTFAAVAPLAAAQLADLQPGRNYPTSDEAFGADHSENAELGDVDLDGDLDVVVANGGDAGPRSNRIFINQGGLQGGAEGSFLEETSTRFAGFPDDSSRDIEFADIDGDGDLDVYVANRGNSLGGEPGRFHVNQGGLQGGTLGFFQEDTEARWGQLVSVDPGDEIGLADGSGPFGNWSCDCDFADLDDDGDLDLFASAYGPNVNGTEPSRIFLNDGSGVFDELWPWADPAADVHLHSLDVDLADLDGDFDLDVFASSRDSQSRVFLNNLYGAVGDTPFSDVTQSSLIDTGAAQQSSHCYEVELGDLDDDGDFDAWMVNYAGPGNALLDRILINQGPLPGGGIDFGMASLLIWGDPNVQESEVDFLDYDGDGDLDAFLASFSGTNWLYQGTRAQGFVPAQGLFHRNDGAIGLAPWPELPASLNSYTSRDGECGDLDGDGDADLVLINDGNQKNRLLLNALGVPDTHAPTVLQWTDQCDKPLGSATVVHVAVRDNDNEHMVRTYDADLFWSVDGGGENQVHLFSQGGMQFRGVIPPQSGTVSYRVEVTDRAGNTGTAGPRSFVQGGSTHGNLGFGLAGAAGVPVLSGSGTWAGGTPISIDISSARPSATAGLFVGLTNNPTPAFGGTLVPVPFFGPFLLATNGAGELSLPATAPHDIPCGLDIYLQYGIDDPAAVGGVALSNALRVTTP